VKGRLERLPVDRPFHVFVDYAHTEDGLQNVLLSLRPLVRGRLITVFGCGGDRDRGKRPKMAAVCEKLSDVTIVTSDNPRTESARAIIDDILEGFSNDATYDVVVDRRDAIGQALKMAQPNDLILLAGKGHETYQTIGTRSIPFDERLIVKELLT
jgi:UDP-N-acetylmuramoyl-L-alanyl-D-glutamate--2,6-diaminopimelate ligase